VRRAFDAIHPRALILVESELWPTAIRVAKQRGIPVVVVNGRISPRTFRRAQWLTPWLRGLLTQVDGFLMQSELDAERIIACGAPRAAVQVTGSLKWEASLAARPSPESIREIAQRLGLNGQEAVIVAGSTHRGEEAALLNAFRALRGTHQSARLIVAPRHLERLSEVEGLIQKTGFTPARLSQASRGTPWNVGLVDRVGQLPRYYGLATVAFIGGSLIPHGGQNPLEAASLGKPIVFGPFMHNFADIAQQLLTHQAARQVTDGRQLTMVLKELLAQQPAAQEMGRRAQALAERAGGATARTLELLRPLVDP
jgi:3-deoxy-D-manno-octulosonic-acid transferase